MLRHELYQLCNKRIVDNESRMLYSTERKVARFSLVHIANKIYRKQLVVKKHVKLIDELSLGSLIVTKHSKSPSAWAHRRWVLRQLATETCTSLDSMWKSELDFCAKIAERYPKNYYAWSQRAWVLQNCSNSLVLL